MSTFASGLASRSRPLDVFVVVWSAIWIGLGIAVGFKVHGLTALSDTVVRGGIALDETGKALGSLRSIPLVGGQIGHVEDQARAAAISAKRSGRSSRDDIETLSVLLAVAIAIAPTVPALVVYLPYRLGQRPVQA